MTIQIRNKIKGVCGSNISIAQFARFLQICHLFSKYGSFDVVKAATASLDRWCTKPATQDPSLCSLWQDSRLERIDEIGRASWSCYNVHPISVGNSNVRRTGNLPSRRSSRGAGRRI